MSLRTLTRRRKERCLFKCDDLVNYYKCMHSFPNPKKKPDLFAAWVSAVGKIFKEEDGALNLKYTRQRICDNHFLDSQKQSKNRLAPGAVPVNLNCVRQSLVTVVEVDHNYAITLRGSSEPAPQVYEAAQDPSRIASDHVYSTTPTRRIYNEHNYVVKTDDDDIDDRWREQLGLPAMSGKGSAETTVERFREGDTHNDHTYGVAKKIVNVPYGDRAPGVYVNPKPQDTLISAPKIDLSPKLLEETHTFDTLAAIDDVLADDVLVDDVIADVPADYPSSVPVPEVEDPAEKRLFSWQRTELIEADDPEEPPPPAPADPTLALYCDPDPAPDQTVPSEPAPAEKDVENRCKDCGEVNKGFEFWCVQCLGGALCGACAGRAPHHAHYVLRAPVTAIRTRTQAVLALIRQQLQNQNLLSQHETVDDGVKVEVKEEPGEEPPASPSPAPAPASPAPAPSEPDPLAPAPRAAPAPATAPAPAPAASDYQLATTYYQCIAEQIANRRNHSEPLILPRLVDSHARKENMPHTQRKLFKVAPSQVKRAFLSHLKKKATTQQSNPQPTPQTFKDNLTQHKGIKYQGAKNTSQTAGNFTGTRHYQNRPLIPIKVTSEPKPSETVIIDLEDVNETAEYLEEGLDSDIETVKEVVLDEETNEGDNGSDGRETNEDDNGSDGRETNEDDYGLDENYLVGKEYLIDYDSDEDRIRNLSRKGAKRRTDAKRTLPVRGPSESMVREDDLSEEDPIESVAGRGVIRRNNTRKTSVRHPSESMGREDDLSDEDPIVNVAGRGAKRKKDAEETSPVRGPCDSMARALPSKAMVQVRPLSSLEIRKWTAGSKRSRKD